MRLTKKEKLFVEFLETRTPSKEMQQVWYDYIEVTMCLKKEDFINLTKKIYVKLKGKYLKPEDLNNLDASLEDCFD